MRQGVWPCRSATDTDTTPPGQRAMLAKTIGCARTVYNDALGLREQARLAGGKYLHFHRGERVPRTGPRRDGRSPRLIPKSRTPAVISCTSSRRTPRYAVYVETLSVRVWPVPDSPGPFTTGWSTFVNMLEHKAVKHGRTFGNIDRWHPSTRACGDCGRLGTSCRCTSGRGPARAAVPTIGM
ncbi:helix-turn-helix domain-containing protein [Micromonospora echinospora]|uniref:helix-turn-helix domain-containing protein n=1 Tax=Micromonospora echinospora TaxID=1877 RepID=UPI003400E958